MRKKNLIITLTVALILIIFLCVYSLFRVEYQPKIVGKETENPCDGVIGYTEMRYTTISGSDFEGLAHYNTKCFFNIELKS